MSYLQKLSVDSMLQNVGKSAKGRRFTHDQKVLYLTEYKKSPATYRSRQKNFNLPTQTTLKKMLNKIPLDSGINDAIRDRLLVARKKMTDDLDAVCVLIWDEVSCDAHFDYDHENDRISGFTSWNGTTSKKIADHGLTFMLRGLLTGWKIPLAYGLCDATTPSNELQDQIKEVVKLCEECNFKIVPSTCDQGSTNRGAIKNLLEETNELKARHGLENCEYYKYNFTTVIILTTVKYCAT